MARKAEALPKFEDWERPWKAEEFDAEKAAKLIYNLHKDKYNLSVKIETKDSEIEELEGERDELETKVTAFEEKDLTEVQRLQRENERLRNGEGKTKEKPKAASKGDDLTAEKYRIALEKGLSAADARRLVGETVEELEADADAFLEEHGTGSAKGDDGEKNGGKGGQAPPSQRPKVKVKTGTAGDEADPDEGLDPGALWDKVTGAA